MASGAWSDLYGGGGRALHRSSDPDSDNLPPLALYLCSFNRAILTSPSLLFPAAYVSREIILSSESCWEN